MSAQQVLEFGLPLYQKGVEKRPLGNLDGRVSDDAKFYGIYRTGDGHLIGTCGRDFTPTQPREALNVLDTLVEGGKVGYETAGTLSEGTTLWISAKVLEDPFEVLPGDLSELFLSVSTAFTSGRGTHVMAHAGRIVCANTEAIAVKEGKRTKRHISVSHRYNDQAAALKTATQALGYAHSAWEQYKTEAQSLVSKQLNPAALAAFAEAVMPSKADPDETGERPVSSKLHNMRLELIRLAVSGPGTEIPGVRGTAWGALQGLTNYTSHGGNSSEQTRLGNLWGGRAAGVVQEGRKFLLTMDPSVYKHSVQGATLAAAPPVAQAVGGRFGSLDL